MFCLISMNKVSINGDVLIRTNVMAVLHKLKWFINLLKTYLVLKFKKIRQRVDQWRYSHNGDILIRIYALKNTAD